MSPPLTLNLLNSVRGIEFVVDSTLNLGRLKLKDLRTRKGGQNTEESHICIRTIFV